MRIEAEAREGRGRTRGCGVRADRAQTVMDFAEPLGRRRLGLRKQACALDIGRKHGVENRRLSRRRLLRHASEPDARGESERAAIEREFARDRLQKRRFARAVAADEADTPPRLEGEIGPREKRPASDADRRLAQGEDGHGPQPMGTGLASTRAAAEERGGFPFPGPWRRGARIGNTPKGRGMAIERTFSIIKPDATRRNLTGKINAIFEEAGLRIVAQKRIWMSRQQAKTFYAVHASRPFFHELVDYMCSGPVVVQVLEGENAVARNRELMGATDPAKAAEGTIRKLYGESIQANSVHGSDSPETAAAEIAYFFAGSEIVG